jgi:hypothetical protein
MRNRRSAEFLPREGDEVDREGEEKHLDQDDKLFKMKLISIRDKKKKILLPESEEDERLDGEEFSDGFFANKTRMMMHSHVEKTESIKSNSVSDIVDKIDKNRTKPMMINT